MTHILLITHEKKREELLSQFLGPKYSVIAGNIDRRRLDSLLHTVGVIIIDFSSLGWEALDTISIVREYDDSAAILGMGEKVNNEVIEEARNRGLTEYVDMSGDIFMLRRLVQEKVEKQMLALRQKEIDISGENSSSLSSGRKERTFWLEERQLFEEMARFLTHGYDLHELTHMFLYLLSKGFGIARLCLLLKDKMRGIYKVEACLGLEEEIKEYIELYPQQGIPKFLTREGTVVTEETISQADFETAHQIKQEMGLIRANVAFPLSPQGELIGILGLGPRITGEDLSPREIEQIFLFSNQVGLAVQNLLFYEQVLYQKKYSENILENASSGVITVDIRRNITTCNPRAQKMLGLGSRNVIGKDMRTLPSPLADILFETLSEGISHLRKEVYVPGIKRWMGVSTNQIKDAEGKVMGSMMIFTDLTPIKYLQEEKKKAQKRDFLAQVAVRLSHELRNSLVPIKSLAELLNSKYLDREFQKQFSSLAIQEIQRMENLIERLVFFSKPLHLDKVAESVFKLLNAAAEKARARTGEEKQILLNLECREDIQVYVDKETMIDAFAHLIINSAEATQQKAAKVSIRCNCIDKLPETICSKTEKKTPSPESAGYIRVDIEDTGTGLPERKTEAIFDPFFTTKNRGIGLGLTISQSIIEEHGGYIIPQKRKGTGTVMKVYLPRYRIPE